MSAKFQRGLGVLLEAARYAELTSGERWEFAVEIEELRKVRLAENDLRFLVRRGYVEHAREVSRAGCKAR
jgi:hypothetical protein